MKGLLVTAVVELGREVISAVIDKRRRQREIARMNEERRKAERALLKKRTRDRIQLAKARYWAERRRDEQAKARLNQLLDELKQPVDANPYE